jgi:hypothetical protein
MSTKQCTRCKEEKTIKAKGLCNACYTAACRENAKKVKVTEVVQHEEEPNVMQMMVLVLKQQEENAMLRQKLELLSLKTNATAKEISLETTTIQVLNTQSSMNSGIIVATTTSLQQMDLSNAFLEEMTSKGLNMTRTSTRSILY